MILQMPTRSPYSRSVTSAMFCLNGAFGGGIVAPPWRCRDSWVPKFSGHTSQGTINVTQIFALSGHSIAAGLAILAPWFWKFLPALKAQFVADQRYMAAI